MLSVGRRGPIDAAVLEQLTQRVAGVVRELLAQAAGLDPDALGWKAPNDLVDPVSGAKLAGILVDVRSSGGVVEQLVVGVGANLLGAPFTTSDGRQATSVEALAEAQPGNRPTRVTALEPLLAQLATRIARELSA